MGFLRSQFAFKTLAFKDSLVFPALRLVKCSFPLIFLGLASGVFEVTSPLPLHAQADYITTVAGNGTIGYPSDAGPATAAELSAPVWLTSTATAQTPRASAPSFNLPAGTYYSSGAVANATYAISTSVSASDEWAWMGGNDTKTQPGGVYGTLGVPAAGYEPGARYGTVGWTDFP